MPNFSLFFKEIQNVVLRLLFFLLEKNSPPFCNLLVFVCSCGENFFKIYSDGRFIIPIRDIFGYIASEKTRLARRYYGTRRFAKPTLPDYFVKKFIFYDLESKIRAWICSVTRCYLLKEKLKNEEKLIIYSNEKLVNQTSEVMKYFSNNIKIPYNSILEKPTLMGDEWLGNSHYGKSKGINKKIQNYYHKILSNQEIMQINDLAGELNAQILSQKSPVLDLEKIDNSLLTDLDYQSKYFDDKEKITLYYALVNTGGRRALITKQTIWSIVAYFFSIFVKIYHIPRILKQNFLPKYGKQNYT